MYIERAIDRAREILEASNDICSDQAFNEFIQSKGIHLSAVWIFAALVRSRLIKQLCRCIILANAIKRVVDREVYVSSRIEGDEKFPKQIFKDDNDILSPLFQECIVYVIESIITKKFEVESKLFKNLLMTLFFYRLESLQFHNALQFEVGTKDYLQGKFILDDVMHVPSENPALFLKVVQNICNVKFSNELLRKCGIDKYLLIYSPAPLHIEAKEGEPNV